MTKIEAGMTDRNVHAYAYMNGNRSNVAPALAAKQPVHVRLVCAHDRVQRVDAAWRRLPVEQLWIGQPVQAIAPALQRTLTICLQAHLGAARQAVRAATQMPHEAAAQASDAAIRLEAARDTLRRWLLDYPRVFGGTWAADALAGWKTIHDAATLTAYGNAHLFGMAPETWLALDDKALDGWIAAGATLPAQWLRQGLAAPLRRQSLPAAADLLTWAGAHAPELLRGGTLAPVPPHAQFDMTPTGRDLPSALLLHRLRRLALACINGDGAHEQGGLRCADIGIGWARTARGLLLHLARIEEGRVRAYRILPPTIWNAAPNGVLAAALTGLARADASRCAEQLLLLLDPCAPFEVTLTDEAQPNAENNGSPRHA
jgi:hypothetical protein